MVVGARKLAMHAYNHRQPPTPHHPSWIHFTYNGVFDGRWGGPQAQQEHIRFSSGAARLWMGRFGELWQAIEGALLAFRMLWSNSKTDTFGSVIMFNNAILHFYPEVR